MFFTWQKLLNTIPMNFHELNTVARYNSRLLFRSWLFRLFFLLTVGYIVLYQVLTQSTLINSYSSGLFSLPSFIPYMNASFFVILQSIPLLFLAGMFLTREKKVDSMDAIYYRPESNAGYVVGMFLGFVRVFLLMATLSLCVGLSIHLFATAAPLNLGIYLFYLVTLVFPALVFMLGFSFFVHGLIRNQALSVTFLLVFTGVVVFYAGDIRQGLFDPLGIALPNTFSGVTGHPDLTGYLLQRLCWLFLGFGFLGLTVLMFKRLPNRPVNRIKVAGVTSILMVVGLLFGVSVYCLQEERMSLRKVYSETYTKYFKAAKGNVVSHEIDFEQRGDRVSAKSRLTLQNRTSEPLSEVILYLNPALDVVSMKDQESDLSFEREHQVLRVRKSVLPGQEIELWMEYEGRIDEQVCYLDVPEEELYHRQRGYLNCRYGMKYVFLRDNFTLLIPECLWYPVAVPPVNPGAFYGIPKDFTTYTLRVSGFGDRKVISQGDRDETGDQVAFHNGQPLQGLSLCMGMFDRKAITVDSTKYELYLFEGHGEMLDGLKILQDTMPDLLRNVKSDFEYQLGRSFPYSQFMLVETPISFASFFRNQRGGSEFMQPEMAFLPERGVGFWRDMSSAKMVKNMPTEYRGTMAEVSEKEMTMNEVGQTLNFLFMNEYDYRSGGSMLRKFVPFMSPLSVDGVSRGNSRYTIFPLFFNDVISMRSDSFPMMDVVVSYILRKEEVAHVNFDGWNRSVDYLNGHSFKDAFDDPEVESGLFYDLLRKKSRELLSLLAVNNISSEQVVGFLRDYVTNHSFQQVEFDSFNELFFRRFGVNWMDVLPSWYTNNQIPIFWIKDFQMENVGKDPKGMSSGSSGGGMGMAMIASGQSAPVYVRVSVYNDSDVDGVISIVAEGMPDFSSPMSRRDLPPLMTRNYLVKAKSGQEIAMVVEGNPFRVTLNTNLSRNQPCLLDFMNRYSCGYTLDTMSYVRELEESYFLPGSGEAIVDNEDGGFQLYAPPSKSFLRDFFNKTSRDKYKKNFIQVDAGSTLAPGVYIANDAYGLSVRSVAYMDEGGGARMEWRNPIEREGEYEVYAYVPSPINVFRLEKNRNSLVGGSSMMSSAISVFGSGPGQPEVKQFYKVLNGDTGQDVAVNVAERGWIFLGRFHFSSGECKVSLSDQGEEEQVILGDAIKWVYVGDK